MTRFTTTTWMTIGLAATLLIGCGTSPSSESSGTANQTTAASPSATEAVLGAGTHCFQATTTVGGESFTEVLRMTVQATGDVSGELSAAQVASPEDIGLTTFEGVLEGTQLMINLWNGFNKGQDPLTWTASRDQVNTGEDVLQPINCATVADRFPGDVSASASVAAPKAATANGSTTTARTGTTNEAEMYRPTAADVLGWADRITPKPVQFASGSTGISLEGGVDRGEVHVYEVQAQAGQSLRAELLLPVPGAATLSILSPNGEILARDEVTAVVALPVNGVYQIAVAGDQQFNAVYYDIVLMVN